ncbi:MAG: nodulation protein NfeD [bacterium]|nr:nodulation protein NfeD [bacterium]
MRNYWIILSLMGLILFIYGFEGKAENSNLIYRVKVEGVINPVTERFLVNAIKKALKDKSRCLIIEMDTPGGLVSSTHNIVKEMLNADIPIVTYISPKGGRAASAGVFISLASDVIAMAPMTHIGAAHPVTMGGGPFSGGGTQTEVMSDKITNDLVAGIKTIAEKKGRNIQWAEDAVRKSKSITEKEALELKVINFIANDLADVLEKLDGMVIKKEKTTINLVTKGIIPQEIKMNFREKFLHAIAEPNVAYILLMLGIYGLIYEFASPGIGLGAVCGSICLLLAFFGLQSLPINLAGILLIILGFILLILEVFAPSHGILAIGGITSMTFGSFMLIDPSAAPFIAVSWKLILSLITATSIFFFICIGAVIRAHRHKITTGKEGIIGETGIAKTRMVKEGLVFAQGEIWTAFVEGEEVIEEGEKVKVVEMEGLKLKVERLK